MKTLSGNFTMVTTLLLSLFFSLSCSTDTDLLAEAVLLDKFPHEGTVVNDFFIVRPNESAILNVLSNDGFTSDDNVRITEISSPTMGSVEISEDATTITYTPQSVSDQNQGENTTDGPRSNSESQEEDDATTNDSSNDENHDENTSNGNSSNSESQEEDESSSEELPIGETQQEGRPVVESSGSEDQSEENSSTSNNETTQDQSATNEVESSSTQESTETTDTFTYTTEVVNEDETTSTEVGTVEVIIESSDEEEETANEDEQESVTAGETTTEDQETPAEPQEVTTTENETNQSVNLLFSSGFEGVSLGAPHDGYQYLSGSDTETGFSWPMRILGSNFSGIHRVNDDGGKAIENKIERTTGPRGTSTSTLFQEVKYDVQVTQTPYQINNIQENPKELYMSYWMKTDDTSVKGIDKWRAIWEYKTDKYATNKDGFRMIAFMATDYQGNPYWLFQGDTSPQNPVWQVANYDIPLIMGEWFKVEYYIKWSDGPDGYASMKVNDQLIGEHTGATTSKSDDMNFIMLTQVYGNSYPMHQWVDDIEIWDGLPN